MILIIGCAGPSVTTPLSDERSRYTGTAEITIPPTKQHLIPTATSVPISTPPSTPDSIITPIATPTPVPPTDTPPPFKAFAQQVIAYLEEPGVMALTPEQREENVEAIARYLGGSTRISERTPTYLEAETEGDAWAAFVNFQPRGRTKAPYSYLFWRVGERVLYQTGIAGDYLIDPVQAARIWQEGSKVELGVIPANFGSTGEALFLLLRLEGERWRVIWDSLAWIWTSPSRPGNWAGSGGKVSFIGEGIACFRLLGPIPDDYPYASRVFLEFGLFAKQQFESIWERQDDSYVRVEGHIVPTPMTTLSDFIAALWDGDEEKAAGLTVDPTLVEQAKQLDWDSKNKGCTNCWIAVRWPDQTESVLDFFDNNTRADHFRITFVQRNEEWLIDSLSRVTVIDAVSDEGQLFWFLYPRGELVHVKGTLTKFDEVTGPPFFTFSLHAESGKTYQVQGAPKTVTLGDRQISPSFLTTQPLVEGSSVEILGWANGQQIIADVVALTGEAPWYYRSFYEEAELRGHIERIEPLADLPIWARTGSSQALQVIPEPARNALIQYEGRLVVMKGTLYLGQRDFRLEEVEIYIREDEAYNRIYPIPARY